MQPDMTGQIAANILHQAGISLMALSLQKLPPEKIEAELLTIPNEQTRQEVRALLVQHGDLVK